MVAAKVEEVREGEMEVEAMVAAVRVEGALAEVAKAVAATVEVAMVEVATAGAATARHTLPWRSPPGQ